MVAVVVLIVIHNLLVDQEVQVVEVKVVILEVMTETLELQTLVVEVVEEEEVLLEQ